MLKQKVKGFTLVELLVALAVSTLFLVAIINVVTNSIRHTTQRMNMARMQEQLLGAMDVMVSEIRRAGYWANSNSMSGTGANSNPFQQSLTDISINGSANCILFSYDAAKNGTLPALGAGSDDDRYGFRLSGNAIQMRLTSSNFSCTSVGASDWENITDPNVVTVSALTFTQTTKSVTVSSSSTATITIRYIDITITGQSKVDSSATMTITNRLVVRNNKFAP